MTTPVCRCATGLLLGLLSSGSALAQNAFVIDQDGKPAIVTKIYDRSVYVKKGEKLVAVQPMRSALAKVPEYFPAFVSVRDMQARSMGVSLLDGGGSTINNEFQFQANFESAFSLPDVFLVLDLTLARGEKQIFYQNVGDISPGHPRSVRVRVPLGFEMGEGKYELHIFTEGREVFHSAQPMNLRDSKLDEMVRKRISGVKDSPPRPLFGPNPVYPAKLAKAKVKGQATVAVTLTRLGVVRESTVETATDPAFGEAAVAAIRQWRFLPRMQKGQAVETEIRVPFNFEAPAESEKEHG